MSSNLKFLSRRDDIGIATLDLGDFSFAVSREAAKLTPEMKQELTKYAEFRGIFPASIAISSGRSLYAKTDPTSDWAQAEIPAIKAKGIAGLSEARGGMGYLEIPGAIAIVDGLRYVVAPPMPENPFIMSDRVHIAFKDNLRLAPKISNPKFWFTLSKDGAEKEFDCQDRLAKHGLGFGALCAGGFIASDSKPRLDGLGKPTGGVFLIHDPHAQLVSRYTTFNTFRTANKELKVFPPSERVDSQKDLSGGYNFQDLIENYIAFSVRIAEVKAQSIFQAGVARHSSHDGNFWYQTSKDAVKMSDNDTCLLLDHEPEETHGTILLRDYSTYLNRFIRQLSLNAFDSAYFSLLTEDSIRPIHRVLEGLFKDVAAPSDIHETARSITKAYLGFFFGEDGVGGPYTNELFSAAKKVIKGISGADAAAGNTYLSDEGKVEWEIAHVNFYESIIPELYALCRKSRLSEIGFFLPDVDLSKLQRDLHEDLGEVKRVYREEFAKDMRRNRGESE